MIDKKEIEKALSEPIPDSLFRLWTDGRIAFRGDHYEIYKSEEIAERNSTLECPVYCPGYIAFANDSGSRIALLKSDQDDGFVFINDASSMRASDMKDTKTNLFQWIAAGCPFETSPALTNQTSAIKEVAIVLLHQVDDRSLQIVRRGLNLNLGLSDMRMIVAPCELIRMSYINAIRRIGELSAIHALAIIDPDTGEVLPANAEFR